MRLLIGYSDEFKEHVPFDPHPETPDRLDALMEGLAEAADVYGLQLERLVGAPVTDEQILRVHGEEVLHALNSIDGKQGYVDPDTYYSPESAKVAKLAAGTGITLVRQLMSEGSSSVGFALLRPPGHHADRNRMMGFCLLNNVAIAAAEAIAEGVERVAIYDFDAHHGNGTQDIFYHRRDVLYISTHQWGIYPGTGRASERGEGAGEGFTLNIPLSEGDGDEELLEALEEVIIPAIREYQPGLLLLSAGFDCMRGDPLARLEVTPSGIEAMFFKIFSYAAESQLPVALFLEGGYSKRNLREAGKALIDAFHALQKGV